MAHDWVRIHARIELLPTEAEGRADALMGPLSYRPNHNFGLADDSGMAIGLVELAEGQAVAPGESFETEIDLLAWPDLLATLAPGRRWRIQEGSKLVGWGEILRVPGRG